MHSCISNERTSEQASERTKRSNGISVKRSNRIRKRKQQNNKNHLIRTLFLILSKYIQNINPLKQEQVSARERFRHCAWFLLLELSPPLYTRSVSFQQNISQSTNDAIAVSWVSTKNICQYFCCQTDAWDVKKFR